MDTDRNNLDKALSPYLKQHAGNPVHWQEWSLEALEEAKKKQKKIFVSIGYSTCHWCHVMASEAFSDQEIAQFLNENFISIKVDREQRPDIDQYFMTYINTTTGGGGWPLNVFLTPDCDPIIAFTYLPVEPKFGMPAMMEILKAVRQSTIINPFERIEPKNKSIGRTLDRIAGILIDSHDNVNGGFGKGHKFPPHCTMLFLLSYYERYKIPQIKDILESTLGVMKDRGLHDHLQGGFFRYCVDDKWTIPHFEKMLYDQAMMLWVYSWAFRVLEKKEYKIVIEGILKCLKETFEHDGLYVSGYDADTGHHEGRTYLWPFEELKKTLDPDELLQFTVSFNITEKGNFEGANHLIRKNAESIDYIEKKLLKVRKKRPQPFADRKIITSWNALTAIGLVMAWRATGDKYLLDRAIDVFEKLIQKHFNGTFLAHSSIDNILQPGEFLEDAASLLLLATYIHEENGDRKELINSLKQVVFRFKEEDWIEAKNKDFIKVPASGFDHPVPSSVSLAEMAISRASVLMNEPIQQIQYGDPFSNDFLNLTAFITEGHWHLIHTPEKLFWNTLPINVIQVYHAEFSDCFEGRCSPSMILSG